MLSGEDKDRLERIVAMAAMGVPEGQIADAVGISAGRLTQIKQNELFQEALSKEMAKRLKERADLDQGWDGVEKAALQIVHDTLKWNKNPDFALKAAMLANRAVRRGGSMLNQPLKSDAGPRVVINLNPTFIQRLQEANNGAISMAQIDQKTIDGNLQTAPMKQVNLLQPGRVEQLLKPPGNEFAVAVEEAMNVHAEE